MPFVTVGAAIGGLVIGNFLGLAIHRLPVIMQRELENSIAYETAQALPHTDCYNLFYPRPSCSHCHGRIARRYTVPLLGYLWLQGRCQLCKAAIPLHYPAIEMLSAFVSAALIWHFGLSVAGIAALAFAYFLITLSFIDARTHLLPDNLTLSLLWLGLLVNLNATFALLADAVLGAVAGYAVLWIIYWCFKLLTGKEGMGYGDFKLMAALGAWLGWQMLPFILLLASSMGALVGISISLFKQQRAIGTVMPFGPYLASAGLLVLPYSQFILAWYTK